MDMLRIKLIILS